MTHSELERELEKKGRELMRMLLQEHLNNRGPGQCDPGVEGADDQLFRLTAGAGLRPQANQRFCS